MVKYHRNNLAMSGNVMCWSFNLMFVSTNVYLEPHFVILFLNRKTILYNGSVHIKIGIVIINCVYLSFQMS